MSIAITTLDNPFDPIDEFDDWYRFDTDKGYNTCAYLDRIALTSDSLSEQENLNEIERAIDEIIKFDFENKYKKVKNNIKYGICGKYNVK